jgi:hypothetical protein
MVDQLPDTDRDLPRVVVTQHVIDKIVRGALLYPEIETGEAMIGLIAPQSGRLEPDIYVLDTISPGEHAVRKWGMFEQGDDWQGDVLQWLYVNWEAFRELRRSSYGSALAAKWDLPLGHVGDWHKHPGDMTEPSLDDADTARHMIDDSETPVEQVLAPIVTMYPLREDKPQQDGEQPDRQEAESAREAVGPGKFLAAVAAEFEAARPEKHKDAPPDTSSRAIVKTLEDKGWTIRIDFWYMSKRTRRFISITPVVWVDDRLPRLPRVAWHLAHPKRFDQEYSLLTEAGYVVDIVRWDADGKPPYEICFSVYRPGSQRVILLVTPVDYPAQMPAIRMAPLVGVTEGEDMFEKVYEVSQPVPPTQMPDWTWDSKRTLIELVWHVEKALKEDGES